MIFSKVLDTLWSSRGEVSKYRAKGQVRRSREQFGIMKAVLSYGAEWVTTPEALQEVANLLAKEPLISVDTETSGWETGNEQLCLIQIGVPSSKQVYLVDVLAVGAPKQLAEVLANPTILTVAHNASFEERQFDRYGLRVKGIRDTLTMSRALRPDLPNHTLRTCCRLLLNKEISKEQQVSDWSRRPLSPEQIEYAALDAEIALDLYFYLAALEEQVNRDIEHDVPTLMAEYASLSRRKFELTAAIAHDLAFLNARQEKLKEVMRQKLGDGAPPYDGEFGKASVTKVKRTEVNPDKVREIYPELAPDVIKEYVDRKRFEALALERGLPKRAIENVLDTVGYNDRLTLALKDDVGALD
jgi:DNA polymerase III epsilon subunit-like protein